MQSRAAELVGRRAELAWLRERLRLAARGAPQCVLLSGEVGIGKTRLATEVREEAQADGFVTLGGRGYEGVGLPFLLFRDDVFPALERILDDGAGPPPALAVVRGERTDARSHETRDDAAPTQLLIDLAKLVLDAAARRPLFVLLDDVHWADGSSIALVRHLVYRIAGGLSATRLLVLAAARPAHNVEPLRREHHCAVVELAGLDAVEAADLARRCGATRAAPREILEQTGGNPLLIESVARGGARAGRPSAMAAAFDAQLAALSSTCNEVLERAALLVPGLTLDTLVRLGRWDEDTLVAAVDEAIVAGVLVGDASHLRFVNQLVRDRCLQHLGPLTIARVHAELARALGPAEGTALLEVARHLVLAGREADPDEVATVATLAAQRASSLCAWEEAAGLFEAALAVQVRRPVPASPEEQAQLHLAAGRCRQYGLDLVGAQRHLERAAELSRQAHDPFGETRASVERLMCLMAGGPVAPDEIQTVESLVGAVELAAPALAADALNAVSEAQWVGGRIGAARATIARALGIAVPQELHGAAGKAYVSRAVTHWITVDLERALDDLRHAEAHVRLADDPTRRIGPAYRLPLTLLWLGRLGEAATAIEHAAARSEEVRSLYEYALALAAQVELSLLRGDLAAADEAGDRALRIQSLSGYTWAAGLFLPALAFARLDRGDADGAEAALVTWEETADDLARIPLSLLRLVSEVRRGEAGAEVLDRLPPLSHEPLLSAQDWAILTIEIARPFGARERIEPAVELIEATLGRGMVVSSSLPVLLSRLAADGHALLGDTEAARRRYADAIGFADRAGTPGEGALARVGLARLETAHDRAAAVVALRPALPVLERLSLGPALAEASALADRLGVEVEPTPTSTDRPVAETATVLFLDVVDSTRLTEELGDEEYRSQARALERRLRLAIAEHEGVAMPGINVGDGLVALFPSPTAAVSASFAAIRAGRSSALRLHVGLHDGSVLRERDAVYGKAVNLAARICACSSPDEVLVSEALYRRLGAGSARGIAFVDRGRQRLKGVAAPERLFAALPAT